MNRLPLLKDMCRCLGREDSDSRVAPTILGKGCARANSCARHQTIIWDSDDEMTPIAGHLCSPGGDEHYIEAYAEGRA